MVATAQQQTTSGTADRLNNSLASIRDVHDFDLTDEHQSRIEDVRFTALSRINRAAPGRPVFVLSVSNHAVLSGAVLRAVLANGPKLSNQDRMDSIPHFMRELNDFGRGFPSYQDYAGSQELHKRPKRVGSLLWASSICFGLAAISLVALIAELL